jgi:GTPase SAR1 family protein
MRLGRTASVLALIVLLAISTTIILKSSSDVKEQSALAQTVSSPTVAGPTASPQAESDPLLKIKRIVTENLVSIVAGVISLIATIIATLFGLLSQRLKAQLKALLLPPPVGIDETRNSVLVVGIGGTGKTSLIKALTGDANANPRISTNEFRIYKYVQEIQNDKGGIRRTNMYFADYIGQDLSSLILGFIEEQKRVYSPLRHGFLNSLIIVVDLFDVPARTGDTISKSETFSKKRVNENVQEWNTQSLQAVFGLFTKSQLMYICLFINKSDLLNRFDADMETLILSAYNDLRDELAQFTRGAMLECVIGSADSGQSVGRLKEALANVRGAQIPIHKPWFSWG